MSSVVMAAYLFQPAFTLSGKGHGQLAEVVGAGGAAPMGAALCT